MTHGTPPNLDEPPEEPGGTGAAARPARLPYEAPAIIAREPLEAMANVCSPSPPGKASGGNNCTILSS